MYHEIVTVTPELAAEWLASPCARQRTTSRTTIAKYSRAMVEGRWIEPTTDPIAFTKDKRLLNGQHRLAALIRAGVSLEMLVARDVSEDLFDIIDTPRVRRAAQFVHAPNALALASAARLVLWYDQRRLADPKHPMAPTGPGAMGYDNDEVLGFIEGEHADLLTQSVGDARRAMRWSGIPASLHTAVLFIARREGADEDRVQDWLFGLIEGVGLDLDDPRRRLRQRLTDTSNSVHLRRSVPAVWMLTVRAFNAWMQGRSVKTLKYEPEDAPPSIDLSGSVGQRDKDARRYSTTHAGVVERMAASAT